MSVVLISLLRKEQIMKACIDGVMRTDHIMVTVNNGKFVSIMFEKH